MERTRRERCGSGSSGAERRAVPHTRRAAVPRLHAAVCGFVSIAVRVPSPVCGDPSCCSRGRLRPFPVRVGLGARLTAVTAAPCGDAAGGGAGKAAPSPEWCGLTLRGFPPCHPSSFSFASFLLFLPFFLMPLCSTSAGVELGTAPHGSSCQPGERRVSKEGLAQWKAPKCPNPALLGSAAIPGVTEPRGCWAPISDPRAPLALNAAQ